MRGKEDYLVTIIWRVNHVPPYENTGKPAHFAVFFGAARRNSGSQSVSAMLFRSLRQSPSGDRGERRQLHRPAALLIGVSGASPGVFV